MQPTPASVESARPAYFNAAVLFSLLAASACAVTAHPVRYLEQAAHEPTDTVQHSRSVSAEIVQHMCLHVCILHVCILHVCILHVGQSHHIVCVGWGQNMPRHQHIEWPSYISIYAAITWTASPVANLLIATDTVAWQNSLHVCITPQQWVWAGLTYKPRRCTH